MTGPGTPYDNFALRGLVSLLAGAWLFGVPALARAQFLIEGVVHDSQSLAPLSDVVVLVLDDQSGLPLSPGLFRDPQQQGQITGADGRYRVELQAGLQVRLSFERPDARFVFPSLLAPPAGIACTEVSCEGGVIDPSATPVAGGVYAIRFLTDAVRSARNNHVPVDPLGRLVKLELAADRDRVARGEHVVFTARLENMSADPIADAEVAIVLPPALRYLAGSESAGSTPVVPRQADLQIRFPLPLAPQTPVVLRFAAKLAEPIREPRVVVRASLERGGGIVLAEATADLTLEGDPNLELSTILGRVFCDRAGAGRPGWQDPEEPGLYGARVYLDTGFYVESDAAGLFSFTGVPAGERLLKLDVDSLPPKSAPLSPIRRQLYLSPGTPGQVAFGIDCRLERWTTATRIERAKRAEQAATSSASPPAVRTLPVAVDADSRTVTLAERIDRFLEPTLEGALGPRTIRFAPGSIGPLTPSRWTIHLVEVDATGGTTRTIRDEALTGRGYPPLFVEIPGDPPPLGHAYRATLELLAGDDDRATSAPLESVAAPRGEASACDRTGRGAVARRRARRGQERARAGTGGAHRDRGALGQRRGPGGRARERPGARRAGQGNPDRARDPRQSHRRGLARLRGAAGPEHDGGPAGQEPQGRILRATPARPRPPPPEVESRHLEIEVDLKRATVPLVNRIPGRADDESGCPGPGGARLPRRPGRDRLHAARGRARPHLASRPAGGGGAVASRGASRARAGTESRGRSLRPRCDSPGSGWSRRRA